MVHSTHSWHFQVPGSYNATEEVKILQDRATQAEKQLAELQARYQNQLQEIQDLADSRKAEVEDLRERLVQINVSLSFCLIILLLADRERDVACVRRRAEKARRSSRYIA